MKNARTVRIVLCRPEGDLNIGSVCRAMKNMGLNELAIVGSPDRFDIGNIKTMALAAVEIYYKARWYPELSDALRNTVLSAGVTRRIGSRRKALSYPPEEFAIKVSEIKSGTVAVVFGNEQNGLTDRELSLCRTAIHIPSDPEFPSLNLSHAVQIIAYALFRIAGNKTGAFEPVGRTEIDRLTDKVRESLSVLGLFGKEDQFGTEQFFREIFTRAQLCRKETVHMSKIFRKIQYTGVKGRD